MWVIEILLIAQLCWMFFKDTTLMPWWFLMIWIITALFIESIIKGIGKGIIEAIRGD